MDKKFIDVEEVERVIRNDVPLKLLMTSSINVAIKNGIEIAEIIKNNATSADVSEAKHGKWGQYKRNNKDNYSVDFRCSVCHRFHFHNGELRRYKYCPECGAKMEA